MVKKTLLIGADGVQIEKFEAVDGVLEMPVLKIPVKDRPLKGHLYYGHAYTGGHAKLLPVQRTLSGPGWATILTGTWHVRHRVAKNEGHFRYSPDYPSLHRRLVRNSVQVTSIATWEGIHQHLADELKDVTTHFYPKDDEAATIKAIEAINLSKDNSTFIFVDLSNVDNTGHASGFEGHEYSDALKLLDRQLISLIEAVSRDTEHDWLIILTTDHGRHYPDGNTHGGTTAPERTLFIAMNKEPNKELPAPPPLEVPPPKERDRLYSINYDYAAQTSVTPTILRHMGLEHELHDGKMESPPLLGEPGVRKAALSMKDALLTWTSTSNSKVKIYKNGLDIGEIPARAGLWKDLDGIKSGDSYILELHGTRAFLAPTYIQVVLDWSPSLLYFIFNNGAYSRFNLPNNTTDSGFPKLIDKDSWSGLESHMPRAVAFFSRHDKLSYVLLNNGTYIAYDRETDAARPGYPREITDNNWPGLEKYKNHLKTALRWKGDKAVIFLKEGAPIKTHRKNGASLKRPTYSKEGEYYLQYDLRADCVEPGYPKEVKATWPHLAPHIKNVVAAAYRGDDKYAYFFLDDLTYLRMNMETNTIPSNYPLAINDQHWPELNW